MMKLVGTLPFAVLLLTFIAGCERPAANQAQSSVAGPSATQTATASSKKHAADWTANEILAQLLRTYREAKTYRDQGLVRLEFRQSGQPVTLSWPSEVAFERPGKLSLAAFQATVKCDGRELKARIEDPTTNNIDGQVVARPAPKELKLSDLAGDRLLYDILCSRLQRQPIQLELLIESSGLVSAFATDVPCQRLADEKHDGRTCFRVEVPSASGPFVFWVDQADMLLRRLDYPPSLVADLTSDPTVSNVSLFADLRGAKIGESIPAATFALDVPAGAKRMKTFVPPPQPLASDLLGQQPREFFFTQLDGAKLRDKDLAGKIAVLIWYHDNPACEATLQQVSLARQRLASDEAVTFFAVATDPTTSNSDALRKRLADWNVELPIVRDLDAFGDSSFRIQGHPTIVILDKRGLVQLFRVGGNPELAGEIVQAVERLKAGNDLAAESITQYTQSKRQYDELIARGGNEPEQVAEVPEAVLRRRSEPAKIKLKKLWKCDELKSPGNIVVAEASQQSAKIYVLESGRTIAEINDKGKLVARHELPLPDQAGITYFRTTTDKSGRRYFVGGAPLGAQFYVFDDAFKLVLTYPPSDQAPLRLVDLAWADVGDADGSPDVIAANLDEVGVLAVTLSGETLWRNRKLANAYSIAVAPPDDVSSTSLLVSGDTGAIVRINRHGHEDPPTPLPNWAVGRMFAGATAAGSPGTFMALATNAKQQPFAVGLTSNLKESWNYPLPAGAHQRPIEPVTSSRMLPGHEGEWWLAGPDGSIHLITADGTLFDSFFYGQALSGIAASKLGEAAALLIATEDGLTAWEVTVPQPAGRSREY
jgi:hypothetical protein